VRALLRNDLPLRLLRDRAFPFVVLSPLCPRGTTWGGLLDDLLALLDELVPLLRGNPRRVHVTGASMGGSGTWMLAAEDPARFASAVPLCASVPNEPGWPRRAARLAHVPVWAFHGKDPVIPVRHARLLEPSTAGRRRSRLTVLPVWPSRVGRRVPRPEAVDVGRAPPRAAALIRRAAASRA
jgi:dienelactone hydrolase